MASKREVLESIPFFQVLNENEMATLENAMEYKVLAKHRPIFSEGDAADYFYILAEGSIKTGIVYEDGRQMLKQILHPRMIFGEMGLIEPEAKQAHFAITLSHNTGFYQIKVDAFRQLMDVNPQLSIAVVSMIGLKLKKTEHQLESLIFKDARGRIIDFILENVNAYGRQVGFETYLKHSLTQQDIASYTGTSRQTVTAVLNDLKKQNKIHFTRTSILVRDMDTLI